MNGNTANRQEGTDPETVSLERAALDELADYVRDDIVMHGIGDEDLEDAVRTAYAALGRDPEGDGL